MTYHAGSEMVLPSPLIFALISPSFVKPFQRQHKEKAKVANVFLLSGDQPKIEIYKQREKDINSLSILQLLLIY